MGRAAARWAWRIGFVTLPACSLFSDLGGLSTGDDDRGVDASKDVSAGDAVQGQEEDGAATDGGGDGPEGCGRGGPTTGLIAYWPFDEGSGATVRDCSPNHYDGTVLSMAPGTTGSFTPGKYGGAIRVSEPYGCVDFGAPPLLHPSSLTASMWFFVDAFPTVPGASGYLVGQSMNAGVDGYRLGTRVVNDAGQMEWTHTVRGTTYEQDTPAPAKGSWHHVAVTFAPNDKLEIFYDGTSVVTKTGFPAIDYTNVAFRIGCRADSANFFAGSVDEVRIYDRVLTSGEIQMLAQ